MEYEHGLNCSKKQPTLTSYCHQYATIIIMTLHSRCFSFINKVELNKPQKKRKRKKEKTSWWSIRRYVFLDQVINKELRKKMFPFIKSMNICKVATSKTQVNFDMQHNHTLCTLSNTRVCENYDYTLALKKKRYPSSPNIHTLSLFYNTVISVHTLSLSKRYFDCKQVLFHVFKSTTAMAFKWTWQHYKLCHTVPHSNKCHISSFTCFKCIFFIYLFFS